MLLFHNGIMSNKVLFGILSENTRNLLHFPKKGVKYHCNRFQKAIAFLPLSAGAGGGFYIICKKRT